MSKVYATVIGVLLFIGVVSGIAKLEDQAIAEKCDYAGKVKLDGRVYTCAPTTQDTRP